MRPRAIIRTLAPCAAALLLSSCGAMAPVTPYPACLSGRPMVRTELYFGQSSRDGAVDARQWAKFVDTEITPRLSSGFTVLDAQGYWRGAGQGLTATEKSRVVVRLHAPGEDEAALAAVIEAYKKFFVQESVLRADMPVCAAF
jgi:hypothetical protein